MRSVGISVINALQERAIVPRDFIWITGRNRTTGVTETVGFWNDFGTITAAVTDGVTGITESRNFTGSGSLISISDVPLTADISIREVEIAMSQINDTVALAVRGYDLRAGSVQIYRGLLSYTTRTLVAPAFPRFIGFINEAHIITPSENQEGYITLTCVSHTVELTRGNTETRSDASQRVRVAGDRFYKYTGVSHEWQIFWGQEEGTVDVNAN